MKPVTQDRLLETLKSIDSYASRATKTERSLVRQACLIGVKRFFDADIEADLNRLVLECDYAGVPRTMESLEQTEDRLARKQHRFAQRRTAVLNIQRRYGVSGLVESEVVLGDRCLTVLEPIEELALLNSDLAKLREEKTRIVTFLQTYIQDHRGSTLYVDIDDEWVACDLSLMQQTAEYYDWAKCWEYSTETTFECSLWLGKGPNTITPTESISFRVAHSISEPTSTIIKIPTTLWQRKTP